MTFGKRILLLVPHPDDEVVGFCASIGRAQQAGALIFALYLTNGCIAQASLWPWERSRYQHYVRRRRMEGEVTAQLLGIHPVGWAERPSRQLWRDMAEVYQEIHGAVQAYQIDQIWTPAFEGGHADHDACNALASHFKQTCNVLEFAEYNFAHQQVQAQTFPLANGSEQVLLLTEAEQNLKRRALALYGSEQKNLTYVGTQRECWRPLPVHDYSRRPHPGVLWYTRFQWVPFRHPRVDFSSPADVADMIGRFCDERRSA